MKALIAAAALVLVSGVAVAQERDARGNIVESQAPNVPTGVNVVPDAPPGSTFRIAPNQTAPFQPAPATATYPPCERGQTDRCTQTWEPGSRRAPRG